MWKNCEKKIVQKIMQKKVRNVIFLVNENINTLIGYIIQLS